jgi:hypothetical protein
MPNGRWNARQPTHARHSPASRVTIIVGLMITLSTRLYPNRKYTGAVGNSIVSEKCCGRCFRQTGAFPLI